MDYWTETIQALEERALELEGFARRSREAAETLRAIADYAPEGRRGLRRAKPEKKDR